MATPQQAPLAKTSTGETLELTVVTALLALIGAIVGGLALSNGHPGAAAVLAPLLPGLFLGNQFLVRRVPRMSSYQKQGGVLASGIMGGGLVLLAAAAGLAQGCFGRSASACVAVDGVPLLLIALVVGLAELWTGFQLLYDWSGAAGRRGLHGALEGIVIALQGIALLLHLIALMGEFGVGAVIVLLVVLFLLSLAFGVSLWFLIVLIIVGIIVLGALVGFFVGVIDDSDERPPIPAPNPPPQGPPAAVLWPLPSLPAQPVPPMPQVPLPPQPVRPPAQLAWYPAPPPPSPPRFCPLCGSPHILVALPPHRQAHCQTCGRDSPW